MFSISIELPPTSEPPTVVVTTVIRKASLLTTKNKGLLESFTTNLSFQFSLILLFKLLLNLKPLALLVSLSNNCVPLNIIPFSS